VARLADTVDSATYSSRGVEEWLRANYGRPIAFGTTNLLLKKSAIARRQSTRWVVAIGMVGGCVAGRWAPRGAAVCVPLADPP
jgi:hypothetical protein